MFDAGTLTFQEFVTSEKLPLATIQSAILEFLREHEDVVVAGAQAVNAYVDEPRMTQAVDLITVRAKEFSNELKGFLASRFHVAIRVRELQNTKRYRIYQLRKPSNRHLADVREVNVLPQAQRVNGVQVIVPAELMASKIVAYYQRRGTLKSGIDWRDIMMLLLTFPKLKTATGAVTERLKATASPPCVMEVWRQFVATDIKPQKDEY